MPALPTRRLLGRQLWIARVFGTVPSEDQFIAPTNREYWVKPKGGLWTSTYLGPEDGSDWVRWCRGEQFDSPDTSAWYALTPRKGLRIIKIDSEADLRRVIDAYPAPMPADWPDILREDAKINYEAVAAAGWDAVHLTERGQWRTRFSRPGLYGWDCESTLWLRWGFSKIELVRETTDTKATIAARRRKAARQRAKWRKMAERFARDRAAEAQNMTDMTVESLTESATLGGDVLRESAG